jgi:predicted RNase H-like HicB family nuclease
MKSIYSVIITPPKDGEKYYSVYVPDLDLYTEGKDIADAINMAKDCIGVWGICEEDAKREIPIGTTLKPDVKDDEIATLVEVDFASYREKNDNKSVRKNCTIPAWLDKKATEQHVNFSAVLQKALVDIIEN